MTDNSRRDFLRKVTAGSAALAAGTITSYASNEMTGQVSPDSSENIESRLIVPKAKGLKITGTFLDEISHGNFDRNAFIAKRNAFITSEVGLTSEEATAFIPLINELQQKMFDIGHEYRQMSRSLKQKADASDAEYTRTVEAGLNAELKQAQLQKEYYEKFKKILSPKKIYLYKRAELKFAREFMKDGDRRQGDNK